MSIRKQSKIIEKIKNEVSIFINDYCGHAQGKRILHESEFKRRYVYSPLKYFHEELGI
jgi:protein AbiQ